MNVKKWDTAELVFDGPSDGNPFKEISLEGIFRYGNRSVRVPGFYDGNGTYKLRFMPDKEGLWSCETLSNSCRLSGQKREFTCLPPDAESHGPVRAANCRHFAYEDGTPYYQVGTTCYAWIHQDARLRKMTLDTLRSAPFNKLRMCIFPKNYVFNQNNPEHFPFPGDEEHGFDFSRFDVQYWKQLDECVLALQDLGIEADIILFHPYDKGRWGFDRMSRDTDDFYLQYAVARLSGYRNIWWSIANEYDLMTEKASSDWDHFGEFVQKLDPARHLRSIHNARLFYNHNKPWVTHCSIQSSDIKDIPLWLGRYANKPLVLDECRYEGNIANRWGNITAKEMVSRFWDCMVRGIYCGHGETYINENDELWWSKGGELVGESPARIGFFRELLSQMPNSFGPLTMDNNNRTRPICGVEGEVYYYYANSSQPVITHFTVPSDQKYFVDIIDTWNMRINTLDDLYTGAFDIPLPGNEYNAVRLRRAD